MQKSASNSIKINKNKRNKNLKWLNMPKNENFKQKKIKIANT